MMTSPHPPAPPSDVDELVAHLHRQLDRIAGLQSGVTDGVGDGLAHEQRQIGEGGGVEAEMRAPEPMAGLGGRPRACEDHVRSGGHGESPFWYLGRPCRWHPTPGRSVDGAEARVTSARLESLTADGRVGRVTLSPSLRFPPRTPRRQSSNLGLPGFVGSTVRVGKGKIDLEVEMRPNFAPAGLSHDDAAAMIELLQERLYGLLDLGLTLKHVHWNVVGPGFIGVHEMLDDHVEAVRLMADEAAERIATLGGIPNGLAGGLTRSRDWDDYALGRAVVAAHLGALDKVYDGVIGDHRAAIEESDEVDPVTNDMLIAQTTKLELFQWFVRAHIENTSGELPTSATQTELDAAVAAATADPLA